jgi:hypothetical protein
VCGSSLHGHRDFVIFCGNVGIFVVQIGSRTGCVDRRVTIIGVSLSDFVAKLLFNSVPLGSWAFSRARSHHRI